MIYAAVAQRNGEKAEELLIRCRFEHPDLTEQCERSYERELLS